VNPTTENSIKNQLISFFQFLGDSGILAAAGILGSAQEKLFCQSSRLRIKYDNLLATSEFTTQAEAKMEYKAAKYNVPGCFDPLHSLL